MPVIKNKSTVENAQFWAHVEAIASAVRQQRNQHSAEASAMVTSKPENKGDAQKAEQVAQECVSEHSSS